jgi:hypothetical protein
MGRGSGARVGRLRRFAVPVVALVAASWSATGSAALPAPEVLVPNTVARISDVPDRAGTITRAEFRHALVLVAAPEGRRAVPKPGGRDYERLKHIALDSLFETVWIKGQAAEMNIAVTRSQVLRMLASIKEGKLRERGRVPQVPEGIALHPARRLRAGRTAAAHPADPGKNRRGNQ